MMLCIPFFFSNIYNNETSIYVAYNDEKVNFIITNLSIEKHFEISKLLDPVANFIIKNYRITVICFLLKYINNPTMSQWPKLSSWKKYEPTKRKKIPEMNLPLSVTLHDDEKEISFHAKAKTMSKVSNLLREMIESNRTAKNLKIKIPTMEHIVPIVSYLKTGKMIRLNWSRKEFPFVWENIAFLGCEDARKEMIAFFQEEAKSKADDYVSDDLVEKVCQEDFESMMDFVNEADLYLLHIAGNSFAPNKITNMIAKWNERKPTQWSTKLLLKATIRSLTIPFELNINIL